MKESRDEKQPLTSANASQPYDPRTTVCRFDTAYFKRVLAERAANTKPFDKQ